MNKKLGYTLAVLVYFILAIKIGFIVTSVVVLVINIVNQLADKETPKYLKIISTMTEGKKLIMTFMISIFALVFWVSPLGMIDVVFNDVDED